MYRAILILLYIITCFIVIITKGGKRMKRKRLLKKGISVGLACMLSISMTIPTIAEEQIISQQTETEQEFETTSETQLAPDETENELEISENQDDSLKLEEKDNEEKDAEIQTDDVTENEEVQEEQKIENSVDDAKQEEQLETDENAVSVQTAKAANSFKIEGTV